MSELLGFPRDRVVGRPFHEVISARDSFGNLHGSGNDALHTMTLRGEAIHPFTLEVLDARGLSVPVVISSDVLWGRNPSAYYIVLRLWPERRHGLTDQLVAALLRRPPLAGSHAETDDPPLRSTGACELTLRQREVLRLLAQGHSAPQIADSLVISVHTVRNHCRNILDRLHAHNQVEAVAVAMRHRLI